MDKITKNIYVGNLPYQMTSDELYNLFIEHGADILMKDDTRNPGEKTPSAMVLPSVNNDGSNRGFGFVEAQFDSEEQFQELVGQLNGFSYNGRSLVVNEARPKSESPRPSFGGGNRGGYGQGNGYGDRRPRY